MDDSLNVYDEPLILAGQIRSRATTAMGVAIQAPEITALYGRVKVTQEFLEFSRSRGNDLMTPAPHLGFPGLSPGDNCACAARWLEACHNGKAPKVY